MKLKKMNHVIMVLLLFTLILGQSSLAFAGKPAPVVKSAIDITTTGFSVTIPEDTNYTFSVNLTSSVPNFSWAISPLDPTLTYSLNAVQIKTSKRSTSYLQTANFVYTPVDDDTAKNATFVISASDGGTVNKDQITVTFNVTPVVEQPLIELNYVSFGDSIATGTYLKYFDNVSYAEKLYNYYQTKSDITSWNDYSRDGDTSTDLKNFLAPLNENDELWNIIADAEIITISIGGNNIMQAAKLTDGSYAFDKADLIDWGLAERNKVAFASDLTEIMQKLRTINQSGKIILMTVYNPYNNDDMTPSSSGSGYRNLHDQVNYYLSNESKNGINDIINANQQFGYLIVDIYSLFEGYAALNKMNDISYFYHWLAKDPHPNTTGQELIFQAHLSQ